MPHSLAILGSTGSIGTATLEIVRQHPERFRVVALAAGRNAAVLAEQVREFAPSYVAVADKSAAELLRAQCRGQHIEIGVGPEAIAALATLSEIDTVVAAIVGAAGLRSTLAAAAAGKRIALANKESMVVAGALVRALAEKSGAEILPVDSEHGAVFQALQGQRRGDVHCVTLTASGGPFRDLPSDQFDAITVESALQHPNWNMGAKITIDSATLMNKGLELIEARWLFDLAPSQLGVLVHRESIVHALVEYLDGSVLAQLAMPDMRLPIAYALAFPERITTGIPRLNLAQLKNLTFSAPDENLFPCLRLAREANAAGGNATTILNAANEVAVEAFLAKRIPFMGIPAVVDAVLQAKSSSASTLSLEDILVCDATARARAGECVARVASRG